MENRQTLNGRKAMEEELIKGRDIANQLHYILVQDRGGEEVELGLVLPFAEDLVHKVLRSFTNTLLLLNTDIDDSREIVMPITTQDASLSVKSPKPEVKDEACNAKRRRGYYKRNNMGEGELNSNGRWLCMEKIWTENDNEFKIPQNECVCRSYYRCTHKYAEGCPAIKQVQRIQEDPPLYRTTYYGHHNCKTSLISSEIMLEPPPSDSSESSMFLNFSNSFPRSRFSFSSSISSSTKEEPMEVISDDYFVHNQLSSSDYLLLCDYELDFNYSRHITMPLSAESVQFDDGSNLYFDG